ncbi:MAG TPA: hypothetical protein VIR04_05180 [Paralcaligenes sp.]
MRGSGLPEQIRCCQGLRLAGWVANTVDPGLPNSDANVATLRARIDAPLLGRVPRLFPGSAPAVQELVNAAAEYLDFSRLPEWPAAR